MNYLYKNLKFLCGARNIKLRDIEKSEQMQPGYFSRLEHRDNCWSVKIGTLLRISKLFDISMESLILKDVEKSWKLLDLKMQKKLIDKEIEALSKEGAADESSK